MPHFIDIEFADLPLTAPLECAIQELADNNTLTYDRETNSLVLPNEAIELLWPIIFELAQLVTPLITNGTLINANVGPQRVVVIFGSRP